MMTMRYGRVGVVTLVALAGCATAAVPPLSPRASAVEIRKADPPPGAVELGPIEAQNGDGCGGFGEKGTFEGAMAELRNAAAERGANYVVLVSQTEPHGEPACYRNAFVLRGIAFRLEPQGPRAPAAIGGRAATSCDPPCSPGYRCSQGMCIALCNPACGPGQVCQQDRTCGPARAPAVAPPPPLAPPAAAPSPGR